MLHSCTHMTTVGVKGLMAGLHQESQLSQKYRASADVVDFGDKLLLAKKFYVHNHCEDALAVVYIYKSSLEAHESAVK